MQKTSWRPSVEESADYWIMRSLMEDQLREVPPWQVMDQTHRRLCAGQGLEFREKYEICPA